jgi:hypothetical protein
MPGHDCSVLPPFHPIAPDHPKGLQAQTDVSEAIVT